MGTKPQEQTPLERLELLAAGRREAAYLAETLRQSQDAAVNIWAEANKETIDLKAAVQASVADLEEQVRADALASYDADPTNKHPYPGADIAVSTDYEYASARAFEWCKAHDMFMTYDDKRFRELCKTTELEFVVRTETPKVRLATDLSKFYPEAK
jgi:hypothetical protein